MAQAQGIYKQLIYKKQVGKGTAASGSGGQILRRETGMLTMEKDTFSSNEINSHQQHVGDDFGVGKVNGSVNGNLSPLTYSALLGSLLRANFAATAALTGLSLTIAGAGPTFTITAGSSAFLTGGVKIGDVVRITAGTYTGVARDINLLVTAVTATVLTVMVVNGKTLSAQGPIATSTVTVIGKKSLTPLTGHTNDYYTFEEWYADISRSRTKTDVQIAKAEIAVPSTGNTTLALTLLGIDEPVSTGAQVLTTPTVETTTSIISSLNGIILVNGAKVITATSLNVSIDGQMQHGESPIGTKRVGDIVKGDMKVTGSFTALYEDDTIGGYFDNETAIAIYAVLPIDGTDTADFVTLCMSRLFVFSNTPDDGKKQIVRTHSFTAEINGAGGAALANDKTTITIQDSAA